MAHLPEERGLTAVRPGSSLASMGYRARWVLAVTIGVGVMCVFNACATTGDGTDPGAAISTKKSPAKDAGTSSGASGSGSGSGSSSGSGSGSSSGSGSGGTLDDATLGDDTSDDAGGEGGDEAGPVAPKCTPGQTCVDQVPSGWTGFVELLLGTGDAGTGACSAPYATSQATGLADPVGAPADCSSCNCMVGDAGPVQCSVGLGTLNYLCVGPSATTPAPANTCVPVSGANGSSVGPTVTSSAGTCSPATALAAPSAPSAVVCALAGDGGAPPADAGSLDAGPSCSTTQACATPFSAPAGSPSGVCIYKAGVMPCPAGSYSAQHVVGASIADTRGCSCGCVNPSCPADGYVTGYTSNNCSGTAATTFNASTACAIGTDIHNSTAFMYHPWHSAFKGACTTVDAGPSGGVTVAAASATTYCCIP